MERWHDLPRLNSASTPSATSPSTPRPPCSPRPTCCATSSTRPCWPTRSASMPSASASTIAPTSPISAPEVVLAAIAGADAPHPPRIGRHRAQHRRSGARVPALLDARTRLERPRRSHSRPRIVHRVVSAVRLRPVPLRRAVRGEAGAVRRAPEGGPGDVDGTHADAARRPAVYPPIERAGSGPGSASAAAPNRWSARPRVRPAADARDHRRQPRRASGRTSISITSRSSSSAADAADGRALAGPRRARPTSRRETSCGRTTRR